MSTKKKLPDRAKITNLNSLFGIDDNNIDEQIKELPLTQLQTFSNHPFKVIENDDMKKLVDSIKDYGIINPLIVRPCNKGYEIISGHRRKKAAEIVGQNTAPCIIQDITDDDAIIKMVDSNLQREKLLPSEKAFAYRMKLDTLSRQGKRTDLTSNQIDQKLNVVKEIGNEAGDSEAQVRRFVRLTYLISELLEDVDKGKLKFNAAVELSYISSKNQSIIYKVISENNIYPSLTQARKLRELDKISIKNVKEILITNIKKERKVSVNTKVLNKYFDDSVSEKEIQKLIVKLLEEHFNGK